MKLKRELYLEQIRPFYDSDIIKVITGVRRAGKSVLLKTITEELNENGIDDSHIIYLNLEDLDYEYIKDASDLNKEIKSRIRDNEKYYLFLDEIQHCPNARTALKFLAQDGRFDVIASGSLLGINYKEVPSFPDRTAPDALFPCPR